MDRRSFIAALLSARLPVSQLIPITLPADVLKEKRKDWVAVWHDKERIRIIADIPVVKKGMLADIVVADLAMDVTKVNISQEVETLDVTAFNDIRPVSLSLSRSVDMQLRLEDKKKAGSPFYFDVDITVQPGRSGQYGVQGIGPPGYMRMMFVGIVRGVRIVG